ncbi:MAG TPA: DegT/DnrJ/EryC1/StrS aminotransferase family protein [Thiotrichales bacterium]|nr:DegT/DnrJ/EryC1/StrS aminotransferase family protein [Thiotrichales bacterium]
MKVPEDGEKEGVCRRMAELFQVNEARDRAFPRPRIPIKPVLTSPVRSEGDRAFPSILSAGKYRLVTSGRVAIAHALQLSGVGPGDAVLVSAYHCSSMIEPILWVGAEPVYYRIREDTSADIEDLESTMAGNVRALLIPHFFGFPQPEMDRLRTWCGERGVVLIEDCAHAFFGMCNGSILGSWGDYAIGSPMKFFPVIDGGVLTSSRHSLDAVRLEPGGLSFQLKSVINSVEAARSYGRLQSVGWLVGAAIGVKDRVWSLMKRGARKRGEGRGAAVPLASEGGYDFDPRWMHTSISEFSRRMILGSDFRSIAESRRANYRLLVSRLSLLSGVTPIRENLEDEAVPYVCPMKFDRPEPAFTRMKEAGVPIVRFGEYLARDVTEEVCPVSVSYSRSVMQFPCHQALTEAEMEWMINTITSIVEGS